MTLLVGLIQNVTLDTFMLKLTLIPFRYQLLFTSLLVLVALERAIFQGLLVLLLPLAR
jgi:hypothetical protein